MHKAKHLVLLSFSGKKVLLLELLGLGCCWEGRYSLLSRRLTPMKECNVS